MPAGRIAVSDLPIPFVFLPGADKNVCPTRLPLAHELLHAVALDVAGVDVALRVQRDSVDPVQIARLLLAVLALTKGKGDIQSYLREREEPSAILVTGRCAFRGRHE